MRLLRWLQPPKTICTPTRSLFFESWLVRSSRSSTKRLYELYIVESRIAQLYSIVLLQLLIIELHRRILYNIPPQTDIIRMRGRGGVIISTLISILSITKLPPFSLNLISIPKQTKHIHIRSSINHSNKSYISYFPYIYTPTHTHPFIARNWFSHFTFCLFSI